MGTLTTIRTSRSQAIAADTCLRKRYLAYHALNGGQVKGWQRKAHAMPLVAGIHVHRGLALVIGGGSAWDAAEEAGISYEADVRERGIDATGDFNEVIAEQRVLVMGLVYAWGLQRWSRIVQEYEVISSEKEGNFSLASDVTWQYRCDAVLRRREDGGIFILEFKTVSNADERWIGQWDFDPQPLLNAYAVERELGTVVAGVMIEGLKKGYRKKEQDEFGNVAFHRQVSPLCYGYHHPGNPPFEEAQWTVEYKRAKGWKRFRVGDVGHPGVREWVDALSTEALEDLFVVVPPVARDEEKVHHKILQIVSREREIEERAEQVATHSKDIPDIIDRYFPQAEHSCVWPSRCEFIDLCWTRGVQVDPLGSGLYIPRVENHPGVDGGGE